MASISIIIPVYNVEGFLNKCIDSVMNQTFNDFELILVNDGSSDRSGEICDSYANKDQRVSVHHIENNGVSNARNIGIKQAKAKYLMFLDSDDWIDVDTCGVAYSKIKEKDADVLFWPYVKETDKSTFKETYLSQNKDIIVDKESTNLKLRVIGMLGGQLKTPTKTDAFNTPWAKLYKKSLIIDNNIRFVERKHVGMEDVLFNIEAINAAEKFAYLNKYYYHYRLDNPNSLTKVDTEALFNKFENLFKAIENIGVKHKDFDLALNNRVACSCINILLSITHPNNKIGFLKELRLISEMLNSKRYKNAFNDFQLGSLRLHWKVFFGFCKYRMTLPLYLLTLVIRKMK